MKKEELLEKLERMREELEAMEIEDAEVIANAPEPEPAEYKESDTVKPTDFEIDDPSGELAAAIASLGSEQAQIRARQEEILEGMERLKAVARRQGFKC